jgi:ssDNA-specific exonuclease RecJ
MTPKQKRTEIKRILSKLEEDNRMIFKRMYSHTDLEKDINLVVDDMPAKQLDWALQQCKNTYHSIFKILAGKA